MLFSEISPYIRYARELKLNQESLFSEVVPVDSRLFYATDGKGSIMVNGKTYEMLPGSLLIINSGTPYHIFTPGESARYLMLNFDYTRRAASLSLPIPPVPKAEFDSSLLVDFNTFDDMDILSDTLYIEKITVIEKKLSSIVNEYAKKLLYYEDKIGHIFAECLSDILRFKDAENAFYDNQSVGKILSYIHENYSSDLTNITLGKIFGYHPNYINQIVHRATGISLHKYVINVRMMNAVSLLENTTYSVGEIAQLCGFCDLPYFSQYFKRHFGIAPSKYR